MKTDVTVAVDPDPQRACETIVEGLVQYNERFLGPRHWLPLAVTARNAEGAIVGGAYGAIQYDRLVVELLWIDEAHRGVGLGSRALEEIEAEANRRGAKRVFLDTFTFQAAPFYEKRGYAEVARIPDYFDGYDRIYLTKPLP